LLEAARAAGKIQVLAAQVTGCEARSGTRLHALQVLDCRQATETSVPADHVIVRLGVSPKMGPIADWGWTLERKQVPVNTENFQQRAPRNFCSRGYKFLSRKAEIDFEWLS